jgi:uncharacterized membrane protein YgcG
MKKFLLPYLIATMCLLSLQGFSQSKEQSKDQPKEDTTAMLGLAGDNLDLYAVLDVFQKSKTIEAFEKSINDPETKVNNLDLNLDKKVDFIKVTTTKGKDSSYTFVLQVDVTKTETQDVAVILLNKEKGKVSLQIVGDPELYGKDYVIEPKGNSSITANPGYTGDNPVTVNVPATTTVVVQSAPIVQYVYSPAYVPYYPPYAYGYYPPWFGFATVMAVGIYRSNNWYHHGGYYGGHYHGGNNNVIINTGNRNNINHYNNNRNTSNTVRNNQGRGSYGNGSTNRPTAGTRPSNGTSNRPSAGTSNRPSTGTSNRPSTGNPSASTRPSAGTSNRPSTGASASPRPSTSNSSMGSSGRTRSSSSGMSSGGGMRGGGGGGRRR